MADKTLENLDLNLMLALHWLLSERNVTEAAKKLGLSQPATSRALGRLRDMFDDPLLIKSGRSMIPTRKAELLLPVVANAVEQMRDVMRISDDFNPMTQEGTFHIACKDHWGALMTKAWVKYVAPEAPLLELNLVELTYDAIPDMTSGKVDLTIIPDLSLLNIPPTLDVEQFVQRPLYTDRFVSAVRLGHPLSNSDVSLDDYLQYDHMLVNPESRSKGTVDHILDKMNKERRIAFRTPSFLMAIPILLQTDCILTAPETLFMSNSTGLKIFDTPLDTPDIPIFSAWHPNWTHNPRHKWIRERLFSNKYT